jgi:hypothetical protein
MEQAREGVTAQVGEAAARRHAAPIASMTLWAALCGAAVILLHSFSVDFGTRLGQYRTGIITAAAIAFNIAYAVRKKMLWLSVRVLRTAMRLPRPLALRFLLFDRLETWRTIHITIGVFVMLPFWWHLQYGRASRLETALETVVILMVLSGFFGAVISDFLPLRMAKWPNQEVRREDVESALHALYVEAEEMVLGHSEQLVHAYLRYVRPILAGNQPAYSMLWATLTGSDPAQNACARARRAGFGLEGDRAIYDNLAGIAERKVRLEHNGFNLRLCTSWLNFHRNLAALTLVLIIFHVIGALYFAGV